MVKKLFKHEFLAWLRVLPIIYGITLAIAAMLRIVVIFENDSVYYHLVHGSAIAMFAIAMCVTVASGTVFAIQRFYKNLFTGEGYLTHTLPVTPANHLWVKVLTAVSFDIISLLVCLLAGIIVSIGDVFSEICKAAGYILHHLSELIPQEIAGHFACWTAEYILLLLISLFSSHFFIYLCICLGQLFRKNRALAAVGIYFGFYVISQILGTVTMIILMVMAQLGTWDSLLEAIVAHPFASIHIFLSGCVVLIALVTLAYYWICHYVIRKKLNLE